MTSPTSPTNTAAPVTMYTTAVCPYCIRAKQLLSKKGVSLMTEIRVDTDPTQRQTMMERTGRRTVPQIYIGNTHVGGCDDLYALEAQGQLDALLQGNAAPSTPSPTTHL